MAGSESINRCDEITMQAAEWLLRMQEREITTESIAAWQRWLSEDPQHVRVFDQLQSLQECINAAPSALWPSELELASDTYDGSVAVASWNRRSLSPPGRITWPHWLGTVLPRARHWYAIAVAVAVLIVTISIGYQYLNAPWSIGTAVGELRRVQLEDGSAITLGGRSHIDVKFTTQQRSITFAGGEVYFEVAKDRQRPFVVHAGDAVITAVGTAFNVRQAESRITVAVAEGVVEVRASLSDAPPRARDDKAATTSLRLSAGQQFRIDANAAPEAVPTSSIGAWRGGRRQYLAEPLAAVIADLQRYSIRRIVLADDDIGQIRITGTVLEADLDTWLRNLETALPVQVQEQDDGSVRITARR